MAKAAPKTGGVLRTTAIVALGLLIALALALAAHLGVTLSAERRTAEAGAETVARLSAAARAVDLAALAALRVLDGADLFEGAVDRLSHGLGEDGDAAPLRLVGAAEFTLRDGEATLRRSTLRGAAAPGPEDAAAIRASAADLAVGLASRLGAHGASLSVAQDGAFWAAWRSADGERALAALLQPQVEGWSIAAADDFADAAANPYRAPFAGGALAITPLATASAVDLRAVAPPLALALMIAGALALFLKADRERSALLGRRHREILLNIAGKQKELEASEERFRHLAESTNVIPWTADLEQQRFTYIGPQIETLSGYAPATWQAHGFWAQHIHPSDRNRVIKAAMERAKDGKYATLDYRIRADNGKIIHIRNMLTIEEEAVENSKRTKKIARGFMLDVTELRKAAAALEIARRKAEEANRVKSEFLANMSHELRTPLNAVIGFSEIMKDEIFGPLDARYREYAESVHASGKHLLELINDVLDLSKIEAGRIELVEEECDVGGLLKECRTLLLERIAAAGLHEKLEIDPRLPKLLIDERRIKQVILNLMSNAIKFTPPGGSVIMSAKFAGERGALITVRDTGIGMAPQEIPRALAKFGQIDGELARKHDGTGLGLPIAKSLVEMHGGEFEILSEKGKGTEMRIWLPQTRLVRAPGAARG